LSDESDVSCYDDVSSNGEVSLYGGDVLRGDVLHGDVLRGDVLHGDGRYLELMKLETQLVEQLVVQLVGQLVGLLVQQWWLPYCGDALCDDDVSSNGEVSLYGGDVRGDVHDDVLLHGGVRDDVLLRGDVHDDVLLRGDAQRDVHLRGDVHDGVLRGDVHDGVLLRGDVHDGVLLHGDVHDDVLPRGDVHDDSYLLFHRVAPWCDGAEVVQLELHSVELLVVQLVGP